MGGATGGAWRARRRWWQDDGEKRENEGGCNTTCGKGKEAGSSPTGGERCRERRMDDKGSTNSSYGAPIRAHHQLEPPSRCRSALTSSPSWPSLPPASQAPRHPPEARKAAVSAWDHYGRRSHSSDGGSVGSCGGEGGGSGSGGEVVGRGGEEWVEGVGRLTAGVRRSRFHVPRRCPLSVPAHRRLPLVPPCRRAHLRPHVCRRERRPPPPTARP